MSLLGFGIGKLLLKWLVLMYWLKGQYGCANQRVIGHRRLYLKIIVSLGTRLFFCGKDFFTLPFLWWHVKKSHALCFTVMSTCRFVNRGRIINKFIGYDRFLRATVWLLFIILINFSWFVIKLCEHIIIRYIGYE